MYQRATKVDCWLSDGADPTHFLNWPEAISWKLMNTGPIIRHYMWIMQNSWPPWIWALEAGVRIRFAKQDFYRQPRTARKTVINKRVASWRYLYVKYKVES